MYYIYVYLDSRKKGSYSFGDFHFEYEPFYIGKGTNDRYLTHLRVAKSSRKGKGNLIISKIKSIINDGFEPIILKIIENLTKENYNTYEILMIKLIGKSCDGLGTLLNTTDGGDGGITWVGEHHNKGKKLEEIVGLEKSLLLKNNLSEQASKRVGELNPNYGNKGESNPMFGTKRSQETIDKIRENTLKQFSNYSKDEIDFMVKRMNDARYIKFTDDEIIVKMNESRKNIPLEIKQEWYNKISKSLKEKSEKGELFNEAHRKRLSDSNYKKLNKGSSKLKVSDETKKKISESLKDRIFTLEHRDKLRKCISYEDFEIIIINLLIELKTITAYRKYAKENPTLKLPIRPEKSYKNCGWSGWKKYRS
jgi:hypothetical protein